ncbi:MAG: LLM class flavin-dependent oxidoreductase [Dehalococcoidia bacterium]
MLHDVGGEGVTTTRQLLDNLREQAVVAEELGFETIWIGEHHFGPYEAGDIPNPILLGADLAARTKRIRIGQLSNIVVWWHPLRLAEDLAILDNLTEGRIEVGFGRGIWPYEGPQFHPNADTRNDQANRELFEETIEVVRKAWTQEYFSHQGPNYTFPAPGTTFSHPLYPPDPAWRDGDEVLKLRVTPKPYQKPHPPMWYTVSTDRSVPFAAKMGLKAAYWQPPPRQVRKRMEVYAEVRSQREGRPFKIGEDQAVTRHAFIASSMEEARRDAEEDLLSAFVYNLPFRGWDVFMNPGEKLKPDAKMDWDFLEPRTLLVGSPDHVVERVQELQEVSNLDNLILAYAHRGVPQKKTLRSLELFGTKVMPLFKGSDEEKTNGLAAS